MPEERIDKENPIVKCLNDRMHKIANALGEAHIMPDRTTALGLVMMGLTLLEEEGADPAKVQEILDFFMERFEAAHSAQESH